MCVYRVNTYVPDHDSSKATSDLRGFVRVYSITLRLVMIRQSSVRVPEFGVRTVGDASATPRRARRDRPVRDAIDRRVRVRVLSSRSGFGAEDGVARALAW